MNVNKQIVASSLVIMAVGIVHAWTAKPPQGITRVVLGGYTLMVVLAIIDMFGPGPASIASALSLLAVVFVLLIEGLPVLQQLGILQGKSTGSSTAGTNVPGSTATGGVAPGGGTAPPAPTV